MSVTLAAGGLEATFLPELGMLGSSLRRRGEEFIALPGGVAAYRDGHQTGLPLLAPWANRLDGWCYRAAGVAVDLTGLPLQTENQLPIHGTMTAASGWTLVERGAARLRARFDYGSRPDLLAAFPFPHEIEVEARLDGDSLEMTTTLRPTSDRSVPVAFGWHPYLRLPTGDRSEWRLSLPARDHLALDARGIPTGAITTEAAEADAIGDRTFDDLYSLGPDRELALESADHRLTVRYDEGFPYAQVFAPPGADFVCLEPMTASTSALTTGACPVVAAGEAFTARFSITPE
jgi:galactose mutarotase-like enzyme